MVMKVEMTPAQKLPPRRRAAGPARVSKIEGPTTARRIRKTPEKTLLPARPTTEEVQQKFKKLRKESAAAMATTRVESLVDAHEVGIAAVEAALKPELEKTPLAIPINDWTLKELSHVSEAIMRRKTGMSDLLERSDNPNDKRIKNMDEDMFRKLEEAVLREINIRNPQIHIEEPVRKETHLSIEDMEAHTDYTPAPLETKGLWRKLRNFLTGK